MYSHYPLFNTTSFDVGLQWIECHNNDSGTECMLTCGQGALTGSNFFSFQPIHDTHTLIHTDIYTNNNYICLTIYTNLNDYLYVVYDGVSDIHFSCINHSSLPPPVNLRA
jgi:hypothetical protein